MDSILQFVLTSVEVRQFGLNWSTFWSLGAAAVTFVQVWGVLAQADTIWRTRRALLISPTTTGFFLAFTWGFIIYGIRADSVVMIFNGLMQAVAWSAVAFGVNRFGVLNRVGYCSLWAQLPVMVLVMVFVDNRQALLAALLVIAIGLFSPQIWILFQTKRVGSFNVKMAISYAAACVFWFAFGVSVDDKALMYVNPFSFLVFMTTVLLYYRYRSNDTIAA